MLAAPVSRGLAVAAVVFALCLVNGTGCTKVGRHGPLAVAQKVDAEAGGMEIADRDDIARESYDRINDNPFHWALREPLSTFSIAVDTASYSNVRRFLQNGRLPPKDAVRIEDFINYFSYDYPQPRGEHPITLHAEAALCPWNDKHQLVLIGLSAKSIAEEQMPPRNLVFLIDTSGSMAAPNRLPLLKHALALLVPQLNQRDRVSIVTYAGRAGIALPATSGDRHQLILGAIDRLEAEGSTNGGEGIVMAYRLAESNFIPGGANRVILGTDGDFNVGVTGADLIRLIEGKRQTGVYLSVLGFGMGNLKDSFMEKLAQHGNGQYAYIDTLAEAHKVFVEQVGGLVPVANDVKVQVELNPTCAQAYRLIGYEHRLLKNQDFNDDRKDAGDMGAGHTVTALYEIVPPGVAIDLPGIDNLKYQQQPLPAGAADNQELLTVKVRYVPPGDTKSRLLALPVKNDKRPCSQASTDFRFAAAVASFGMLLRESPYKGNASYAKVLESAREAMRPDTHGHRQEFLRLVQTAQNLANQP
jgi:Ca-activated chloride channel family protein